MDRERRQTADQLAARVAADVTADARRASGWERSVGEMRVMGDRSHPDGGSWVEITTPDGDTITVDYYPLGRRGIARLVAGEATRTRRAG